MTERQTPPPSSLEAEAAELLKKALNRRLMFGAGFVGAAALLVQACSNSVFSGATSSATPKKPGNQPPGGSDGGTPTQECAQIKTKTQCESDTDCQWEDASSECSAIGSECAGMSTEPDCTADAACQWTNSQCSAKAGTPAAGGTGTGTGTGTVDGTGNTAGGLGDGTDTNACYANTATQLNVASVPAATGGYVPTVKFYGRDGSGMVAILFGNGASDINQVVVTDTKGNLLALHGITAADKKADGSWRPVVIDNISLADSGIVVLAQAKSGTFQTAVPKQYFTTFNGKTVLDLSQQTVPAGFMGNQSVTRFGEGVSGAAGDLSTFKQDPNTQYPGKYNGNTNRSLNVAMSTSMWKVQTTAGDGVDGTVTDVMGNPINIDGNAILEYQVFCTYVDCGDGTHVARTMLHIG